jgi:Arc/MetJ family transcription regulator
MRTTLDIPEDLLADAQGILGYKSKTDVVIAALRELVRRHKIQKLKELAGQVEIDIDLDRSRRRSRRR